MSQLLFADLPDDDQRLIRHWAELHRRPAKHKEHNLLAHAVLIEASLRAAQGMNPDFPSAREEPAALIAAYETALAEARETRSKNARGKDRHAHRDDPLTPVELAQSYMDAALVALAAEDMQRDLIHSMSTTSLRDLIPPSPAYLDKDWRKSPEWLGFLNEQTHETKSWSTLVDKKTTPPALQELKQKAERLIEISHHDVYWETAIHIQEEYFACAWKLAGNDGIQNTPTDNQSGEPISDYLGKYAPTGQMLNLVINNTDPQAATEEQRKLMAVCAAPLQEALEKFRRKSLGKGVGTN